MAATIRIRTPDDFDFWRTAFSHGWAELPPFSLDRTTRTLSLTLLLPGDVVVPCSVRQPGATLTITAEAGRTFTPGEREEVLRQVRTCLRLDEEFAPFHREARRYPHYRWIARTRSGRLLRAPTVFEDAVKMICTTNCTWALTTIMVRSLVQELGSGSPGGPRTFPTARAIAGVSESFLRTRCSTGYRAGSLLALATKVADGTLNIERWRISPLPTGELFQEMLKVKGIGPYAAGNLLKLVGRYDELGLDSWVRKQYARLHTRGRKVSDARIARHYERYGSWRGLFFWLEMTRFWHDEKFARAIDRRNGV